MSMSIMMRNPVRMVLGLCETVYEYNDLSAAVEREAGLVLLCESYWGVEARREIENAVDKINGVKSQMDLDRWVRKMLYEQRQMKYGGCDDRKKKYGRSWWRG